MEAEGKLSRYNFSNSRTAKKDICSINNYLKTVKSAAMKTQDIQAVIETAI